MAQIVTTQVATGHNRSKVVRTFLAVAATLIVAAGLNPSACAADLPKPQPAEWVDPLYTEPYIDIDEWRDVPVRHRYVHGGFKGTENRFSFYMPPKEQYQGRFFQPVTPTSGNENVAQQVNPQVNPAITQEIGTIGFAIASGGYLVESNLGRASIFPGPDNTIVGYRGAAAAAKYSKVVAAEMYGPHRTYGYAYGPSGGSLKAISLAESTSGVWDGFVPYVTGTTLSMPNMFSIQAHAMRVLNGKYSTIVDAIDPGGSGDMYAGLNQEEREALAEVTRMGFPPAAWAFARKVGLQFTGTLAAWVDNIVKWDPTYFDDFWKVPGYLGANPPESLQRVRIQHNTKIARVVLTDEGRKMGIQLPMAARAAGVGPIPAAVQLESMPEGNLIGATLIVKSGPAKGSKLLSPGVSGDLVLVGYGEDQYASAIQIKAGDEVQIDNSIYLAVQTYHRHQIPTPDYYVWDQFKGKDGKPLYPQRPELLGPRFQMDAAGSIQSGKVNGKMIVLETLMDEIAYPWQADWYRSKVKAALGNRFADNFGLYFVEHAMHGAPANPVEGTRIINYTGVLQQTLRDLAAWVEKGVKPPADTAYKVVDGQVQVPKGAAERKGIQPVVTVTANGGARADVAVGKPVTFSAVVEAPPNTGKIVAAEWDFEGTGEYPVIAQLTAAGASGGRATVKATYTFSKPGTYFPVLRATSQREGDAASPYARARNLGRVRVVVK